MSESDSTHVRGNGDSEKESLCVLFYKELGIKKELNECLPL